MLFPMSKGVSDVSAASRASGASKWTSSPVLQSEFLIILPHSGMENHSITPDFLEEFGSFFLTCLMKEERGESRMGGRARGSGLGRSDSRIRIMRARLLLLLLWLLLRRIILLQARRGLHVLVGSLRRRDGI